MTEASPLHRATYAGLTAGAVGLGAFSVDALRRNGWRATIPASAPHAPLRASMPAAAVGIAAGTALGATLIADRLSAESSSDVRTSLLSGVALTGASVVGGLLMARRAAPKFLPLNEFVGFAAPAGAAGLAATIAVPLMTPNPSWAA